MLSKGGKTNIIIMTYHEREEKYAFSKSSGRDHRAWVLNRSKVAWDTFTSRVTFIYSVLGSALHKHLNNTVQFKSKNVMQPDP